MILSSIIQCEKIKETLLNINGELERIMDYSKNNCLQLTAEKSGFILTRSHFNLRKVKTNKRDLIIIEKGVIERVFEMKI